MREISHEEAIKAIEPDQEHASDDSSGTRSFRLGPWPVRRTV